MEIFGVPIQTDESLLPNIVKVVQPNGEEKVFTLDGTEVIDNKP